MTRGDVALLLANVVYGTSYLVTRVIVADVPPATLALGRLLIGAVILVPLARARGGSAAPSLTGRDRWALFWMGALGFGAAFWLANQGLLRSTATNGALLITVEPVSIMMLSPVLLGERLTRREVAAAGLAVVGATLVVLDGIPGASVDVTPHWRGDALLILSGLAYASYSLLGRSVLARHAAARVTSWSLAWGAVTMAPAGPSSGRGASGPRGPRSAWPGSPTSAR